MRRQMLTALFAATCGPLAIAATYYVDFDGGKDDHPGTSPAEAFRRAPGDPAATGTPATLTLQPGDVVRFKGGVHYRGNVLIKASGIEGKPIVLDGNTDGQYGTGRAIIDGSDLLTDWQRCAAAEDCLGNPNWQQIYWAQGPAGTQPLGWNLAEDGKLMFPAENPNSDSQYLCVSRNYLKVDAKQATPTSVIDPRLKELGGEKLAGAFIAVYCKPDWIHFTRIVGFDPATNKLTFEKHPQIKEFYKEFAYSILNSVLAIDKPGEFCFDEKTNRVYLWPYAAGDMTGTRITISRRNYGIQLQGVNYVTVRGFRIQQVACGLGGKGGTGLLASGGCSHLLIQDNELTMNRSMAKHGVMVMNKVTHSVVEKNHIFHNPFYRVLMLDDFDDSICRDNVLDTNSGTGIVCFRVDNSKILNNVIKKHVAVHSQGMAIYAKCNNVLVEGNRVYDGLAVTVQDSQNVTIRNNLFDARGHGTVIGLWSGPKATCLIAHNVLVGAATDGWAAGLAIFSNNTDKESRYEVVNNILEGVSGSNLPPENVRNNLFLQAGSFEKYKENGNLLETDQKKVFADPDKEDYRLCPGSPALGAGVPLDQIPNDLSGKPRPKDKPSLGAFEGAAQ